MSLTHLDSNQILPLIYDQANNAIQVELGGSGIDPTTGAQKVEQINSLVTQPYNEIDLTYVASGNGVGQIQTATYKLNGTTVATLTLTYNSANNISTVIKS